LIVDSSAIVAIFLREPGAEALLSAIFDADYVGIGAPTAAETGIVLTNRLRRDATRLLRRFFEEADIDIIPFGAVDWQFAVQAYERFGKGHHPAALNFGDCMTYATASFAGEPLLCCGDDFPQTDLEIV
jgi:ribonuclease VapC